MNSTLMAVTAPAISVTFWWLLGVWVVIIVVIGVLLHEN